MNTSKSTATRNDAGVAALEYGAIVLLVGAVFAAIVATGIPATAVPKMSAAVCKIFGSANCAGVIAQRKPKPANANSKKSKSKKKNSAKKARIDPGYVDKGMEVNQTLAKELAEKKGWKGKEWNCLDELLKHEGHYNPAAKNPHSSAYGIPQALPGEKMATAGADWETNPATQINWGLDYIAKRYKTPCRAWSLWQKRIPHWY